MDLPKHYSLVKDHEKHFEIHDSRHDKRFQVAKKELHPAHQLKIMKMQKFDEGGEVDSEEAPAVPSYLQANPQESPQSMDASINYSSNPDQGVTPEQSPIPISGVSQAATPQSVTGLVNQQANAEMTAAKAQAESNTAQAAKWDAYLDDENHRQQDFQSRLQSYQQNADKISQEIASSRIDPKQYWHNSNTGQKVAAGVAMLLGGLSQGLMRGGPNPGMAAIQDTINKDIDAQKSELGKKQTLLGDNLRIQGNLMAAENATRLHASSILQGEIQKTALQSGNPIVIAKAQQAVAQLKLQSVPLIQNVAMNQTRMQVLNALQKGDVSKQDPAKFVQWVVPSDKQKEVFGEIKRAQDVRATKQDILDAYDKAAEEMHGWVGGMSAASLGHYSPQSLKNFNQLLLTTVKDLEGTAREFAMKNAQENLAPNATQWKGTQKQQRKAVETYLDQKSAAPMARGFGIDLDKFNSTAPYQTPQYETKGGQKYMKVPGGWAPAGG